LCTARADRPKAIAYRYKKDVHISNVISATEYWRITGYIMYRPTRLRLIHEQRRHYIPNCGSEETLVHQRKDKLNFLTLYAGS
jgi:hypothetical protein